MKTWNCILCSPRKFHNEHLRFRCFCRKKFVCVDCTERLNLEIICGSDIRSSKTTTFCVCAEKQFLQRLPSVIGKRKSLTPPFDDDSKCRKNSVGLITDARMAEHKCSVGYHVENPKRIVSILSALKSLPLQNLQPREATDQELSTCHNISAIMKQIETVHSRTQNEEEEEDKVEMYAVPQKTALAARLAAGCSIQLVQDILANRVESGFALVRPPGHHSHYDRISGFCFFNNALLAAVEASRSVKVVLIDVDIHNGDGSADILSRIDNNNIAFVSIHRYDDGEYFPHVGANGLTRNGKTMNVTYNGGKGDKYYDNVFINHVVPFAKQFNPQIVVVSAGFDAAKGDPLGNSFVTPNGYKKIMRHIQSISRNIALILEGGYNLDAIAASSKACVEVLLE